MCLLNIWTRLTLLTRKRKSLCTGLTMGMKMRRSWSWRSWMDWVNVCSVGQMVNLSTLGIAVCVGEKGKTGFHLIANLSTKDGGSYDSRTIKDGGSYVSRTIRKQNNKLLLQLWIIPPVPLQTPPPLPSLSGLLPKTCVCSAWQEKGPQVWFMAALHTRWSNPYTIIIIIIIIIIRSVVTHVLRNYGKKEKQNAQFADEVWRESFESYIPEDCIVLIIFFNCRAVIPILIHVYHLQIRPANKLLLLLQLPALSLSLSLSTPPVPHAKGKHSLLLSNCGKSQFFLF